MLVGPALEGGYLEICRHVGGDRFLYLDRLPRELVASAYKAARVHALPSFAEGSALANLEAASAACPIVVSNRSSEFEYFGDAPYYCDPADPASIRAAVQQAWDQGPREPERWLALSERMREYTWERTARATLTAYERVLATPRPAPEVEGLRSFVALSFADELIEALPLGTRDASETMLPRRVHAVFSHREPTTPFAAAPRFDETRIGELRALAERRWREVA